MAPLSSRERHRPEQTTLDRLVQQHAATFSAQADDAAGVDPAPAAGWPVLVWMQGTTTVLSKSCAPSLTLDTLDGGPTAEGFRSDHAALIASYVGAGYAVVAPDLEGIGPAATTPYPCYNGDSSARSLIAGLYAGIQNFFVAMMSTALGTASGSTVDTAPLMGADLAALLPTMRSQCVFSAFGAIAGDVAKLCRCRPWPYRQRGQHRGAGLLGGAVCAVTLQVLHHCPCPQPPPRPLPAPPTASWTWPRTTAIHCAMR